MEPSRLKRRKEIKDALAFIQSSLAYPEPEGYQDFLTQLVWNLLDEGNASFRDRKWEQAVKEFTEGLNVSRYAAAEDIHISEVLLESLFVNRAAAYHSMGEYDQGTEDCNSALQVCKESRRALYRKALCLRELGKYREAYDCTTEYLLINRLDKQVNELAQELAVHLGLNMRKPYIGTNVLEMDHTTISEDVPNGQMMTEVIKVPGAHLGSGINPLSSIAPAPDVVGALEDSEVMGEDLDSLLDCFPNQQEPAETDTQPLSTCTAPSVLPPPTPQLPPAFFTSVVSQLNSLDSFSGGGIGATSATLDALDDLSLYETGGGVAAPNLGLMSTTLDSLDGLDSLDDFSDATPSVAATTATSAATENESKTELDAGDMSLDDLLDELDPLEAGSGPAGLNADVPKAGVKAAVQFDSLDALDSFPSPGGAVTALPAVFIGGAGLDSLSDFISSDVSGSHSAAAPVTRSPKVISKEKSRQAQATVSNPLSSTHEFLQACSTCYPRKGSGIYSFVHKPDLVHSCEGNVLLCRRKASDPSEWTRVRPMPSDVSFSGPFVLCRELKSGDQCKYGEDCKFAYNQLEIDVWSEERRGMLDRRLLFETEAARSDPVNRITHLLQEHKCMFMFLCQKCFDNKPQIISRRCRDNNTICSNLAACHAFDTNKCLAVMVRSHSITYNKVRPLSAPYHFDLCSHAMRYRCSREDGCLFAHSVIELKTWKVQRDTGISPDEIVKLSTKYHDRQEQNSNKHKGNRLSSGGGGNKPRAAAAAAGAGGAGAGGGKNLNLNMKFVCPQCWLGGQIINPDKALKCCTAKARHEWTKDRLILLVKSTERGKWAQVRPLPHTKNFPMQYDMCTQILDKRKCSYSGDCTFAHSQEEKKMWMYMKNNELLDMLQVYDMWLASNNNSRQADGDTLNQAVPEKSIVMPTDYAEPMNGFYCHLCGRHSNGERQWQQHISSEKHKDRVFSCEGEGEALKWNHRFPGAYIQLCPKLDGGCPDGVSCDYAHSPEELQEWTERRDFLRKKLAKAREEMLIMPNESDFGKYNFLFQD